MLEENVKFQLKATEYKDVIYGPFKTSWSPVLMVAVRGLVYELTLDSKEIRKRNDLGIDDGLIQVYKFCAD